MIFWNAMNMPHYSTEYPQLNPLHKQTILGMWLNITSVLINYPVNEILYIFNTWLSSFPYFSFVGSNQSHNCNLLISQNVCQHSLALQNIDTDSSFFYFCWGLDKACAPQLWQMGKDHLECLASVRIWTRDLKVTFSR